MTALTLIEPVAGPVTADLPLAPRQGVLEPAARTFLEAIADLPSLASLGPARARDAIARIQAATDVEAPAVDIEDMTVPVPGPLSHLPFRILRPSGVKGQLPVILYILPWPANGLRGVSRCSVSEEPLDDVWLLLAALQVCT
jgi:hypothetical protein